MNKILKTICIVMWFFCAMYSIYLGHVGYAFSFIFAILWRAEYND
jgi:hypothetical protein